MLLHLVTARWQQSPELAPLWGFPLPWAWWPPASSLHWDLSIAALTVDLLAYTIPVAAVGQLIGFHLPPLPNWSRRAGFVLVLGLSVWVGLFWLVGLSSGWHRIVLLLPTDQITRLSACFASGCYLTY